MARTGYSRKSKERIRRRLNKKFALYSRMKNLRERRERERQDKIAIATGAVKKVAEKLNRHEKLKQSQ